MVQLIICEQSILSFYFHFNLKNQKDILKFDFGRKGFTKMVVFSILVGFFILLSGIYFIITLGYYEI